MGDNFWIVQRKGDAWNVLSGVVVEADTIVVFKRVLERNMNVQGMEGN